MKAVVTIHKGALKGKESLIPTLSNLCARVEESNAEFIFSPKAKANMDFICLLVNDEIPYRLKIENSVTKSVTG